ncbi:MAG: translation initiation factor IF-3 [Tissierellia bacterium]|nr:translation initiation factor IF-3 [Tissierellia bacterium]
MPAFFNVNYTLAGFNTLGGVIIKELQINEEIREKKVRLIDENGEQIGIVPIEVAMNKAHSKNLDLALIAPKANPSVAKIMDYGKYRYEMIKKEKEDRKKQKTIQVKEVRLSVNIEDHDLNTKANQAKKFLKNGDKVKVSVRFRGRELGHKDLGYDVINKFSDMVGDIGIVDVKPKMEGRNLVMFLVENQDK